MSRRDEDGDLQGLEPSDTPKTAEEVIAEWMFGDGDTIALVESAMAAGKAEFRDSLIVAATVAFKGPNDTDASMLRTAADKLDRGFEMGGSNLRAAVARVLVVVAAALDDTGIENPHEQ